MSPTAGLSSLRIAFAALSTRALVIAGTATLCLGMATIVLARETHQISQKDRTFSPKELTVANGDIVRFLNDDSRIHQIFVQSRGFNFDSAEAEPGRSIDVQFPTPGTYEVRCHIHPKMLMTVTVK